MTQCPFSRGMIDCVHEGPMPGIWAPRATRILPRASLGAVSGLYAPPLPANAFLQRRFVNDFFNDEFGKMRSIRLTRLLLSHTASQWCGRTTSSVAVEMPEVPVVFSSTTPPAGDFSES